MSLSSSLGLILILVAAPAYSQVRNYNSVSPSDEELKQYLVISDELWTQLGKPSAPPYPTLSKGAGFYGPVEVLMQVDSKGKVVTSDSRKSALYHPSLSPMAVGWCRTLKFPPSNAPDAQIRKFKVFVTFSKAGMVEIQPTLESHFK